MLSIENIAYDISRKEDNVSVNIYIKNFAWGGVQFEYACYLLKDDIIAQKKMYQKSSQFQFHLEDNGTYSFALFIKECGKVECEPVIKYTEKFEVRSYEIAVIADTEISEICASINGMSVHRYDSPDEDVSEECIFADIIYLVDSYTKKYKKDELAASQAKSMLRDYVKQGKRLILLLRYIDGYQNEIMNAIIKEALLLRIKFIDCHQILNRQENGTLQYEDYSRFCKVLRQDLENFLFMSSNQWSILKMYIDVKRREDTLDFKIINEAAAGNEEYNYYILKDGQVYYKHGKWEEKNEFSFILSENGIYTVQGYVRQHGKVKIIKSHTIAFFSEDLKKEFTDLCNRSLLKQNKLEFFKLSEPWADFAFIQSKDKIDKIDIEDFTLYNMKSYASRNHYLLSTVAPIERHNKTWLCSGVLSTTEELLYGNDMLDVIVTLDDTKLTGLYSIVEISDERIHIANDFFAFNRIFYYVDNDVIVCTNRYHLLLLVVKALGLELKLDEAKALMTVSSVNHSYFTQNTCNRMDMEKVYQCANSYDIIVDKNGLSFELNEYGKILREKRFINEKEYRENLDKGRKEIVSNINAIMKAERDKNIVIDLTGGLDSRVVYGAALQNEMGRERFSIRTLDVTGSKDCEIANNINSIYQIPWETAKEERKKLNTKYNDMMQRSFYMGLYYSHNLIGASVRNQSDIRLSGACGEILLRPYSSRKYIDTELADVTEAEKYLDYILRDWSEHIIVDHTASMEFVHYMLEEFENYADCSLMEMLDRVYLEHRHGYHFETTLMWQLGVRILMPLQSKTLFKLHHNIYDMQCSIKLQMDMLNLIEPYLAAFPYDSENDNVDRNKLRDVLLYEKDYYRYLKLDQLNSNRDEYDMRLQEKARNTTRIADEGCEESIDFYQETLEAWCYLCNHSKMIKERAGVAIYYYILNHHEEKDKKKLRFLYNKIISLKDQVVIFTV